jgi:hypothetical protein
MPLAPEVRDALVTTLKTRFEKHAKRHHGIGWASVLARLDANPDKVLSLYQMEATGGEPDVVALDSRTGEVIFYDCAEETPLGRRSLCFDRAALDARKANKPANSAMDLAAEMGVTLLSETQYRDLQTLGKFDQKTSSWIQTPAEIRKLGGALFMDRRYNTVFLYHNGAESYYAGRGFRASLRV